jgi:murein DD-endopeptidase MepM/ murein hydrolase activator NlpD
MLYGHLDAVLPLDGSQVMPGEVLGFEGATGCATGPHLHFQVDVNGDPVNPCQVLPDGYPAARTADGHCWGTAPPS